MTDDDERGKRLRKGIRHDGRPMYFDRQGNPLGLHEWAAKFEGREYQIVARDELSIPGVADGDAFVSTVWLGLDHNHSGEGPPLIFETMAFAGTVESALAPGRKYLNDLGIQLRYSTEAEARFGHAAVLHVVRNGLAQHGSVGDLKAMLAASESAFSVEATRDRDDKPDDDNQKQ